MVHPAGRIRRRARRSLRGGPRGAGARDRGAEAGRCGRAGRDPGRGARAASRGVPVRRRSGRAERAGPATRHATPWHRPGLVGFRPLRRGGGRGGAPLSLAERTWTRLEVEPSGLANLARVTALTEERNTVLARHHRLAAHAEQGPGARVQRPRGGLPQRHAPLPGRRHVSVQGLPVPGQHRLLRHLFLPLREGENELVVAVSESFGGWGLQARFPDPEGLALD